MNLLKLFLELLQSYTPDELSARLDLLPQNFNTLSIVQVWSFLCISCISSGQLPTPLIRVINGRQVAAFFVVISQVDYKGTACELFTRILSSMSSSFFSTSYPQLISLVSGGLSCLAPAPPCWIPIIPIMSSQLTLLKSARRIAFRRQDMLLNYPWFWLSHCYWEKFFCNVCAHLVGSVNM